MVIFRRLPMKNGDFNHSLPIKNGDFILTIAMSMFIRGEHFTHQKLLSRQAQGLEPKALGHAIDSRSDRWCLGGRK